MTRRSSTDSRAAIVWRRIESIVPPERPPRRRRTKSTVSVSSPAPSSRATRAVSQTPMSEGIESKPHEWTTRAPERWATSWNASAESRTKSTSPVRSA